MKTYKGRVSVVSEKPWTDRDTGENITLHSFQLEGMRKWFRTGTNKPPLAEGDTVQFVEDRNNVDIGTIEQISASEVRPAPAPSRAPTTGGSKAAPKEDWNARSKYWDDKEKRDVAVTQPMIEYQSARNCAVQLVTAALQHDALAFGNAAKGKRLDMLLEYVEEVTKSLVDKSNEFKNELEEDAK